MDVVALILYVLAAVCFAASLLSYHRDLTVRSYNLTAAGLLFWVLVPLINSVRALS